MSVRDHRARASGPLVTIALPVYNGAHYVRRAIGCVLEQTYSNIELIISDNASTDETPEICREMQGRDPRIRFYRNQENVGAARNYNQAFRRARGKYFKWAAHDDVMAPTFVERAVEVLEADPTIVLCTSQTGRIDGNEAVTGSYVFDPAWDDVSPLARFERLVMAPHACVIIFGLIRHEELSRTPLIGPYVSSDRVLLAELGLRGRIHEVPEALFFRREHRRSSIRAFPDHRQRIVWFDPSKSPTFSFPEWFKVLGYAGAVLRAPLRLRDRVSCWQTVLALAVSLWRPLLADFKYAALGMVGRKSS